MNSLYQKYHGTPGIGVHGLPGEKGNTGNGIFIGFINDFFDSNDISVNTIVKIAQRIINAQEYNGDFKEFADSRYESYMDKYSNATDTSYMSIAEDAFLKEANSLYYSGRTEEFTTTNGKQKVYDIMDNKEDTNNVYINNNDELVHENPYTDHYVFKQIYNITQGDKTHVQLYEYNQDDEEQFTNDPKYDVQIDVNHMTYEPQDVVKIFGGYSQYNAPIYGSMDDIDPESIDLFFNYLKYKEKPDPNSLWLEKPITYDISYEESDNKSFFERYPFTIDRDSIYSQINMDSWSENDKKKYTSNPYYTSGAGYATGVDSHFSVKTSDNTNITYDYNYTELPSGVKVNGVIDNELDDTDPNYRKSRKVYIDSGNVSVGDFFLTQYVHVTANTLPPAILTEAFVDDFGYTQIGLDMYDPAIYDTLKYNRNTNKYEFNDVLLYNILNQKNQETLKNFATNYRHITKEFLEKYEVTINHYKTKGAVYPDSSVRWSTKDYEKISIPTTLSSKYQPGDVLYFYIDEKQFAQDGQIHYMVTLTEDLLNCDINTLIKNADAFDPFKYQTVFNNNNRIQLYDNVNILKNNIKSTQEENYYMRSFGNIISDNMTAAMVMAPKADREETYNQLQLVTYKNLDTSAYLQINSSIIDGFMNYNLSSNNTIKFDNFYIKDDILLTNLESEKVLYDKNIIYGLDDCIPALSADNVIVKVNMGDIFENAQITAFNTYVFKFDKSMFINDPTQYKNYQVGYIVYSGDNIIDEKLYANTENIFTIELDPITDSDIIHKDITDFPYEDEITYDILVFIHKLSGFNIFSHTTSITCKFEYREPYKLIQPEYSISVGSDTLDIVSANNEVDNIIFSISGITVNETTEDDTIIFDISTNNEDVYIDSIFFNNTELPVNKKFWEWADTPENMLEVSTRLTTNITWVNIQPDIDSILHGTGHKRFLLHVKDNIPDIMSNNKNVVTHNIADFMCTFNDSETQNSNTFNYEDLFFNTTDDDIQCILFDRIMEEQAVSMAAPRTLNVAVKYHLLNENTQATNGQHSVFYENYEIKQPGFSDPRVVPHIDLKIHTDVNELESYNTINSGILCNQFQTFMDINISEFDYDSWAKYISDINDTTLDVDITNIPNDLEWQKSLSVSQSYTRATIKLLPDNNVILDETNITDNTKYNNCVKFSVNVFKNTSGKSLDKLTQNDINELSAAFNNKCQLTVNPKLMNSIVGRDLTEDEIINGYIILSNDICKGLMNPSVIYRGIFENIKIHLHDLTVEDVQDTIYAQIMLEFGNPILSNLYLQFAVSKLTVHYKGNNGTDYTFSTYADKNNMVDTYLHQAEDYKETYKFASNKLDLMINPISLIACPGEAETELSYLSGSVKKTGSEDQIKLVMEFFGNSLYEDEKIISINNVLKRNQQKLDLNGLQIKYKHLQDNVKSISFECLSLTDTVNKVANNYIYKYADYESILTQNKQYEPISNKNYLSVIYHSTLMNPKLREDKRTFYYNEKLYLESKYDQFNMNCPVFISQEHDWNVRTDDIMTAIDTWNFEYQSQKNLEENSKVFPGILNNFGNGYMYLPDEIDTNLYVRNNVLSLTETKEYNNQTLYDKSDYFEIGTPTPININTPSEGKYFRVPLYHMTWEYPVYNGTNILPYYIVSLFDYMIIKSFKDDVITIQDVRKYNLNTYSIKNIIPYNLLFNIAPKILYNDDTETLNMFMLRKPSIEDDHDLTSSCIDDCYKLNTRYYNTVDEISTYQPDRYDIPS